MVGGSLLPLHVYLDTSFLLGRRRHGATHLVGMVHPTRNAQVQWDAFHTDLPCLYSGSRGLSSPLFAERRR